MSKRSLKISLEKSLQKFGQNNIFINKGEFINIILSIKAKNVEDGSLKIKFNRAYFDLSDGKEVCKLSKGTYQKDISWVLITKRVTKKPQNISFTAKFGYLIQIANLLVIVKENIVN